MAQRHTRDIKCWLSLLDPYRRNIKLITEFASPAISENLVGEGLVSIDNVKLKGVCNNHKIIANGRVMRKRRIPQTISNVKVPSHNKNIINIDLNILEIF